MSLRNDLERIDEFFEKMSIEEFDSMLESCGINEITCASDNGMELSLTISKNVIDKILMEDSARCYTKKVVINNSDFYTCDKNMIKAA